MERRHDKPIATEKKGGIQEEILRDLNVVLDGIVFSVYLALERISPTDARIKGQLDDIFVNAEDIESATVVRPVSPEVANPKGRA